MEEVKRIIATGGASSNKGILQVLSDVFDVPVFTLEQSDSASLGAALRAAHGFRCAQKGGLCPGFITVLAPPEAALGAIAKRGEEAAGHLRGLDLLNAEDAHGFPKTPHLQRISMSRALPGNHMGIDAPRALRQLRAEEPAAYAKTEAFKVWGCFLLVTFTVFMLFSSGDFSFLLTLSSLVSVFSFLMVALKIEAGRSCKGVSLRMMECYLAIFFFRLCAIVPFEGYLPFDKSGDWFYQTCEALGFCLAGTMVYFCRMRYAATYDPDTDNFQHHWLALGAAGLALIFHPNLNNFLPSDTSWAFAVYLESVAVLCQLFMFMKEGQAAPHTSHFLAAQALSKIMSFIFWASSFNELSTLGGAPHVSCPALGVGGVTFGEQLQLPKNPNHTIKAFVGNWVVCTQLVQLCVMGDFIYHYIRCIRQGIPVSQLLCSDNVSFVSSVENRAWIIEVSRAISSPAWPASARRPWAMRRRPSRVRLPKAEAAALPGEAVDVDVAGKWLAASVLAASVLAA
eukprot:g13143.t1